MFSSKYRSTFMCIAMLAIASIFIASIKPQPVSAVKATDFNAGNIIDDAVFYNKDAMTLDQIEAFIQSHTVTCDTWGVGPVGAGTTLMV